MRMLTDANPRHVAMSAAEESLKSMGKPGALPILFVQSNVQKDIDFVNTKIWTNMDAKSRHVVYIKERIRRAFSALEIVHPYAKKAKI